MVGLFSIRELLLSAMQYPVLNAMSITVLSLELRGHCRRGWKDSKSQRQWWVPWDSAFRSWQGHCVCEHTEALSA